MKKITVLKTERLTPDMVHRVRIPEVCDNASEFFRTADELQKASKILSFTDYQFAVSAYRTEVHRKLHSLVREDEFAEENYNGILTSEQVEAYLDELEVKGMLPQEKTAALDATLDYLVQKCLDEYEGVLPLEEAAMVMLRESMRHAFANGSLKFWDSPEFRVPDVIILEENKDDEPPQTPFEDEED